MQRKDNVLFKAEPAPIRLTVRLTADAYDAIIEIQRRHRRKTGRALRLWQVLDDAIRAHANTQGIKAGE